MTRISLLLLVLTATAYPEPCRLRLQTNSAHTWDQWDQELRLKKLGYSPAGPQARSELARTAAGERVAQQNVWLMRDERSGKVLCTAQVNVFLKETRMRLETTALAVADELAERESMPACGSAFDKIFAKLAACPQMR